MKNNLNKNVEIAEIKKDILSLNEKTDRIEIELEKVKNLISNEIMHKFDWVSQELLSFNNSFNKQINEIKDKIFYGFVIGITSIVILQIILKFFI